ncbi:MAG TPA: ABC transporter permease [Streptosporangiaceae bacterium]|nr:ABC transporter permease [Streptosporangiaceae bacterium]
MSTTTFKMAASPAAVRRLAWTISDAAAVAGRNLRHIPRVPEKLAMVSFQPVIFVLLFGYLFGSAITVPGGSYRQFVVAGIFTQMMVLGASTAAVGIADDLAKGLVDRFRSLPMARSAVLIGRTTADLALSVVSCAVMAGAGFVIGWRISHGIPAALGGFALLLLLGFAMAWVGALIGLLIRDVEAVNAATFGVLMPVTFLSNAFIPVSHLPGWLQAIAAWNPVSATVTSCRQLFGNHAGAPASSWPSQHAIALSTGWSALILLTCAPLAVRAYRAAAIR